MYNEICKVHRLMCKFTDGSVNCTDEYVKYVNLQMKG